MHCKKPEVLGGETLQPQIAVLPFSFKNSSPCSVLTVSLQFNILKSCHNIKQGKCGGQTTPVAELDSLSTRRMCGVEMSISLKLKKTNKQTKTPKTACKQSWVTS